MTFVILCEREREINVPSSKSCETFTLHRARHEEENTSNSVLKSGATMRSEILVIFGHRAARQETSRVLFRFDDRILGSGFSSTEDALFDRHNMSTRNALEAKRPGVYRVNITDAEDVSVCKFVVSYKFDG
ncbi:hypothetical protein ALC53_14035 [Atta colombica]|uniref:Uncharacterized protein n=1 Tax=Atta colombica TaxID=520822 RepID=A0A195AU73_9HYME|nr:hypothetical protein ALC53_14035 [Atta colombica]